MERPSRAAWLVLAATVALFAAFEAVGPLRSVRLAACGFDRVRHLGALREVGGMVVQLPASWYETGRATPRGTAELRLVRVPATRSAPNAVAIVRRVNFDLSRQDVERELDQLQFDTPAYGAWRASAVHDVDLGGRPGLEVRFERTEVGADGDAVASDFMLPEQRVWVQCAPMSAAELAQCRGIAASATVH